MVSGRYRICLVAGRGVQCFRHRAVVRHRTYGGCTVRSHDNLGREHVRGRSRDAAHVLIGFRNRRYRHVAQTVIAAVGCNGLLRFGGRYGLALQAVVAAAGHTADSTGTVMVAFRDGVCVAFPYRCGYCATIYDIVNRVSQRVLFAGACRLSEIDLFVAYRITRVCLSCNFRCSAHVLPAPF